MTYDEMLAHLLEVADALRAEAARRGHSWTCQQINDEVWTVIPASVRAYRQVFEPAIISHLTSADETRTKSSSARVKPHGSIASLVVGGPNPGPVALQLPNTKEELEDFAAKNFLKSPIHGESMTAQDFLGVVRLEQNPTDDFDFRLSTQNGTKHLELMEVAPLQLFKSDYKGAPNAHDRHEFASAIFEKIDRKSRRYGEQHASDLLLLLYITEDKFHLSDGELALLQYWLLDGQHAFEHVFYSPPMPGIPSTALYLSDPDWISGAQASFRDFDEESVRGQVINLVAEGWNFGHGDD